jgi:hypothetical protein
MDLVLIVGLVVSVIASVLMAYGRIFRSKHEIVKESNDNEGLNESRMKHKLIETRVAQVGALLLVAGFTIQVIAHIMFG